MKIYDKSGNLILEVTVDDNSYRNRVISGDHNLTLYYSLPQHIEIPVGAYCEFEQTRYTLMRPEQLKMKHTRQYEYTVTFSSDQDKAKIWKFRNPVDGRLKFSLTAKPKEHLQMVVDNMNRHDSGWTVGDCIDDVEKLVTYDHDYCWDALSKQASAFDTEFEINGKTVSLHKVEYNKSNPLPLSYGKGNGFKSGIGRDNSGDKMPVEILFVQGGERNIDRSKYPKNATLRASSNGCLLLPAGQTIGYDGEHFEDETGYNSATAKHYKVDDLGLAIRNIDKQLSTEVEDSLDRSEDYPKRVGTISQVVEADPAKNFYDFIDSSIPAELNYEDCLIGEESMTVIFQSGMLAGREFDVKYFHTAKQVGNTTKAARRFEIIPQEIDGVMMPGGNFKPKAGDTYAIFNVMLPDAYINAQIAADGMVDPTKPKQGAEWDMFRQAVKCLFDNEQPKFTFTGELDGIWAKKDWTNIGDKIKLGGFIKFTNEQFAQDGVLVRITAIKDYINKPHSPKIELSNEVASGSVAATIRDLESREIIIDENHRAALQFTKRRFRDAKETIEMIETALSDDFTNRINPIAVETMSLLVGDERLQFQFVAQPGSTTAIPHEITWNTATRQLSAEAGTIQHLTLGIDSIRPSHAANEYHYWNVGGFESAVLEDASAKYFLYIRAQKTYSGEAGSAEFRLETVAHKLEEGDYYWLLVGVLNTEYNGERSFATLYGFTEVLPGRITADRLLASDGQSYFDMLNAAMKLKDKLQFNVNGDGQLKFKGVMVQSQNGIDEAPLGCYRGEYNPQTTYFNGDEVVYRPTADSPLSTYRCIASSSITNIPPTDTLSWQVAAAGVAGADGADGEPGDYTEYLFANNGSTTEFPGYPTAPTGLNPDGWSNTMPSVATGNYVWMTYARKSGNGLTLKNAWSTPVRITPKDGQDGADGQAPVLVYRGVYDETKTYYGTDIRIDCVKYGEQYYVARTDAGEFGNFIPTDTSMWNAFGSSFESVATSLLLAENANIANLIFRNQRLESESTTDGVPNFFIDGLNNIASFAAGNVVFNKMMAKIGWLTIIGKDLVGYDDEGMERLRLTPENIPEASQVGTTTILAVKAHGGSSTFTGETNTEVSFSQYVQHVEDNGTHTDTLDGWVEFDIAENNTRLDFSDLIQISNIFDGNNGRIPNSAIHTTFFVSVLRQSSLSKWEPVGGADIKKGERYVSVPCAGHIRVNIQSQVTITGYPEWHGEIEVMGQGITGTTAREQIFIGKNGLMCVSNANYMRFTWTEGFSTCVGSYGFKVTTSGLSITSNGGTSWNPIKIANII